MTRARDLASLLDSGGNVITSALSNVPDNAHIDYVDTGNVTSMQNIFSNVDVSDYNTAAFFGRGECTTSGASGSVTFRASISFDGGTTFNHLIARSTHNNGTSDQTTGFTVDVSSINTLDFQAGLTFDSNSGSNRTSRVRGIFILCNTLAT